MLVSMMVEVPEDPRDPRWGSPFPPFIREFRAHQLDAVRDVMDAYEQGAEIVMLDAPVGAGKTLIAEMVRRLLAVKKATYICSGLELQDQFVRDFGGAVLKGKANYPTKLGPSWVTCGDCTGKECGWCPTFGECTYQEAKRLALISPLAVLNTSYFLRFKQRGFVRELVTIDECDTLESIVMGTYEMYVSEKMMGEMGVEPLIKGARKPRMIRWLEEFAIALQQEIVRTKQAMVARPNEVTLIRGLTRLQARIDLTATVIRDLEAGGESADNWVRDYRDGKKDLILKPVQVHDQARELLWDRGGNDTKWLLMSGTIISSEEMAASLGMPEDAWELVRVANTFPVERRPIVLRATADMSRKGGREAWELALTELTRIVDMHADESILVHAVSYPLSTFLADGLKAAGVKRVLTYTNSQDRGDVIRKFKELDGGGVIVAPSMDRGIDLPGDLCRVQVVAKIPFPYLGDRQVSERMRLPGGQSWYSVATARVLVQMTGRGMRSEDDRCATYVLDRQFGRWWKDGKKLLPKWWQEAIVGGQIPPAWFDLDNPLSGNQ
jgi:ATP-dependent DNA helicase DinG